MNHASPVERTDHYMLWSVALGVDLDSRTPDAVPTDGARAIALGPSETKRYRTHCPSSRRSLWNPANEWGTGASPYRATSTSCALFAQPEKHVLEYIGRLQIFQAQNRGRNGPEDRPRATIVIERVHPESSQTRHLEGKIGLQELFVVLALLVIHDVVHEVVHGLVVERWDVDAPTSPSTRIIGGKPAERCRSDAPFFTPKASSSPISIYVFLVWAGATETATRVR